jgi:hypothetical protein
LQAATSHAVALALAIGPRLARGRCAKILGLDRDRSRLSQSFSRGACTLGNSFQAKPSGRKLFEASSPYLTFFSEPPPTRPVFAWCEKCALRKE